MYTLTDTTTIKRDADGAMIPADPANRDYQEYLAWVAAGNTPAQVPGPTLAQVTATLEAATQAYLDAVAARKGYDSANSCISYINSTNAAWKADAAAMNTWRDSVWAICIANTPNIIVTTTWANVLALLPAAPW